jgi:hypothetical protein
MTTLIMLLQLTTIDNKVKSKYDIGYDIGVLIGSFLPMVILAGLVYWMYHQIKKSNRKK